MVDGEMVGAIATGLTLVVVLVAKFTEGAWITAILVPALIITMNAVKRHYDRVARQIAVDCPMRVENLVEPLVSSHLIAGPALPKRAFASR